MIYAVEHGLHIELVPLACADFHVLPKATALLTCATRIVAQFLAPDDDGACVFSRLDRHGHDARGEGGGV